METSEHAEVVDPKPPERSPAWAAFWIAAGIVAAWPVWGAHLFGMATAALDPLVMLVFSVPCAFLITGERARHGTGVTPRTLTCLAVFLAILAFILFRPFVIFGDSTDVSVFITVLDRETRGEVNGARVTATDGRGELARAVTAGDGRALLKFELRTSTSHSWLLSWRTFDPVSVAIEVNAAGYARSKESVGRQAEFSIHLIQVSLPPVPKQDTIIVVLPLKWADREGDFW